MINPIILIHAIAGEVGLFAFLWIIVELLNPTDARINRAKIAAFIGVTCLLLAWVLGGFYYVEIYGDAVKPIIKASGAKWAHSIVMEVKEHVFLFLPILSVSVAALLFHFDKELLKKADARLSIILLSGLIFLLGFAIAGMGALIGAGYRVALEGVLA